MTTPQAAVRVDDLSFGVLDQGDIPIETADYSNGLVAVMSAGAVICTGIHTGNAQVGVEARTSPPAEGDDGSWEEIVEVSVHAPHGELRVESLENGPVASLPPLSTSGPGWYRLRAHARGRDTHRDGVADEPVEDYLLISWPHDAAPAVLIRTTDRTGESFRASPTGETTPPAQATKQQDAEGPTRDAERNNLLKHLGKRSSG